MSWNYCLYKGGEELVLTVVCGTVGLYAVTIRLTAEEKQHYARVGQAFVNDLSAQIQRHPSLDWSRRMANF